MRRLTFKDLVATVVVAAVAIPYVGYLFRGKMPFIEDPDRRSHHDHARHARLSAGSLRRTGGPESRGPLAPPMQSLLAGC